MTPNRAFGHILLSVLLLVIFVQAKAGLRDIHPRPQQMGLTEPEVVSFAGIPYLVIPDNPTEQETRVRDEAIRLFEERTGATPPVLQWSSYTNQEPTIWLGTFLRFPQLAAALQNTGIAGMGTLSHLEEYQLAVEDNRILLGGNDERSLRWGLMSLMQLTNPLMGQLFIDRAYIRDWPDYPKRVGTVNSTVRIADQVAWSTALVDLCYDARMNEIEWNNADAGLRTANSYCQTQAVQLASRIRNYGMNLTMSVDRTGYTVSQMSWQEGLPVNGTVMVVTDTGFVPVDKGYAIDFANGGFESWSGSRPTGWSMTRDSLFSYVTRDIVEKHSGTSSLKFSGFSSQSFADLTLRQTVTTGPNKMLKIRFWYKTEDYCGQVYVDLQGVTSPYNRYNNNYLVQSCPSSKGWTLYQFSFYSFNADRILVLVGPKSSTSGSIWIDDLEFTTSELQNVIRREDTPLEIHTVPNNVFLAEETDYRVVETYATNYTQYVYKPRIERLSGGRLSAGDTVTVNWSAALKYQGARQTVCFSLLDPLLGYQENIRHVDSLLHPDGFKIHINEVSYTNFDEACTRRNLTPAELVGSYCRQMYQIIQARRPNAPVRIYGDAFDIFVKDARAMPVTASPWTIGALQELPAPIEVMCMEGYSTNLDSSLNYFADNQHQSVMSAGLWLSTSRLVKAVQTAARHSNCVGTEFFVWEGDCDSELAWRVPFMGDLSWNMGPYIIHDPVQLRGRADSLRITAEMWSDTFCSTISPSITTATLNYRLLPGGNWTAVSMSQAGTDRYSALIPSIGTGVSSIEYYLTATDHRELTRRAPADAPQKTFIITIPSASSVGGVPGGDLINFSLNEDSGFWTLEWKSDEEIAWYEIHRGLPLDLSDESSTRIARQSTACPRFLLVTDHYKQLDPDSFFVVAFRREEEKIPSKWEMEARR
jgi:hypothetical protein